MRHLQEGGRITIQQTQKAKRNPIVHIMNIKEEKYKDIWYGCLQIKTKNRNDEMLGAVEGAYVNLLAKAHNKEEFLSIIKEYATELGFVFVELSDVSTIQDRLACKNGIANDLRTKIKTLNKYGHIRFGTFHTY